MRTSRLLCLAGAALWLGGCATARSDGSPRVQTTSDANRENLAGAAASPLRDLNVMRTRIPDVLVQALADPYARPASTACPDLTAALKPLDDALGADLDIPSVDEDDLLDRGRGTVLGAVAGAASDVIPFRGWVRRLSGADQHDSFIQAAITAGAVRRGYLKGLGESKGCLPPATPSHVKAGSPVLQPGKPRYPVR